jgi:predicted enzyme related to lactoylglutathione lyase
MMEGIMSLKSIRDWAVLLALALAPLPAAAQGKPKMPAPIVFVDIVGAELPKQAQFYREVFGWQVGPGGNFAVPAATPMQGTLRVEDPKKNPIERVIYLGVPDINATLAAIAAHGGKTVLPRLEVPNVAILALFTDPAGNRMGLVEMNGDKAKVPGAR